MKELKFRAWHKTKKEMFTMPNLEGFFAYVESDENYEVMQFTGLKDINNKEIFEGDIIQYNNTFTEVKWSKVNERFIDYDSPLGIGFTIYWQEEDKPEIIGNIYENPELLKKCF